MPRLGDHFSIVKGFLCALLELHKVDSDALQFACLQLWCGVLLHSLKLYFEEDKCY